MYDGHGGQEVAQYCSTHLPAYIKNTEAYKNGDIEQALIQGFLGFDATMTTKPVVDILKVCTSLSKVIRENSNLPLGTCRRHGSRRSGRTGECQ